MRTGGQILVEGLRAFGVRHAFCVPGESYLGALDAFYDCEEIQLVVCRQEGGAAYMAEAYGKLRGVPGVCFVSRGPGAANAMIGVHTAFQDSTPMLLFVGQVARAERGREAFQELDYARVYGGVAKAVMRVEGAGEVAGVLREAWRAAVSGRRGPVVVELPEDVLMEEAEADLGDAPVAERGVVSAGEVRRVEELLEGCARGVVIAGGGGWSARCNDLLRRFSEGYGLAVACAFRRQDMFDNGHGNYIGDLGVGVRAGLREFVRGCDLVIALGARLGEITTGGYTLFDVPEFDKEGRRKLVHVFPCEEELGAVFRAEVGIVCDVEGFLEGMVAGVEGKGRAIRMGAGAGAGAAAEVGEARAGYLAHVEGAKFSKEGVAAEAGKGVDMGAVMRFLRGRLGRDDIVANGAGNFARWCGCYQFREFGTQLASTNGSMGYGVPAGIAGKIVRPQAMVVSFSGDGCFLMNGQELATAVRYGLGVIFIVVNNGCYGTIRMHQERVFPGRVVGTDLVNPDFVALAEAYGAFGVRVTETGEFAGAFEAAVEAGRAAVIEVVGEI